MRCFHAFLYGNSGKCSDCLFFKYKQSELFVHKEEKNAVSWSVCET